MPGLELPEMLVVHWDRSGNHATGDLGSSTCWAMPRLGQMVQAWARRRVRRHASGDRLLRRSRMVQPQETSHRTNQHRIHLRRIQTMMICSK